jgi:hypothetical protein
MGAKAELEYEAVNVRVDTNAEKWGPSPALAKAANDMAAAGGWTLVSCSHPRDTWAVLVFSRPRRAAGDQEKPSKPGGRPVTCAKLASGVLAYGAARAAAVATAAGRLLRRAGAGNVIFAASLLALALATCAWPWLVLEVAAWTAGSLLLALLWMIVAVP